MLQGMLTYKPFLCDRFLFDLSLMKLLHRHLRKEQKLILENVEHSV